MRRRFFISVLALSMLVMGIAAADSSELEIVASKPREDAGTLWIWHADVTDLYGGRSTLANGANIMHGDQVEMDLLSFPSSSDGIWMDMFQLEFETNSLVKSDVRIAVSPFMNMEDGDEVHPVEFTISSETDYSTPDGFEHSFTPAVDESRSGVSEGALGYVEDWKLIDVPQMASIVNGKDEWGYFRHVITVSGRFSEDLVEEDLLGHTWVMPVSVTLTVEGE